VRSLPAPRATGRRKPTGMRSLPCAPPRSWE
jgi:hypothetical protein